MAGYSYVLALLLLATPPDLSQVKVEDYELHPALGLVITVGNQQYSYPILETQFVTECLISWDGEALCYNKTRMILGELMLTREICNVCEWRWVDIDNQ